jgi:peptidoglycan/xylan/chitin deacetylase (PgdA/CDA1 family)
MLLKATALSNSIGLRWRLEKNGLLCLLFHAVTEPGAIGVRPETIPVVGLNISEFRQIFECFLEAGYNFISADQITEELLGTGRYIHVTFDDGYYNNIKILPLLEEYQIPAHIFVTTTNVLLNQRFWWDVLYEHMVLSGKNWKEIARKIELLKRWGHRQIADHFIDSLGASAFVPKSDANRPLMPDELKAFSIHPLITIGNHTQDHVILSRVDRAIAKEQIYGAQRDLHSIIGHEPSSFAFPNGNYNDETIRLLDEMGFKLGFSCDWRWNRLSRDLEGESRLVLGRYSFVSGLDLTIQAETFRVAGYSPLILAKKMKQITNRTLQ